MQIKETYKGVKIATSVVRVTWCFLPLYIFKKHHDGRK